MKIRLEYVTGGESEFLNFWNCMTGDDVCCEIINGELWKSEYDSEANELPKTKLTFTEFLNLVRTKQQ